MDDSLRPEWLTTTEQAELLKELSINGVKGGTSYLHRKTEHWKTVPLKLGVIGSSGVGKSSFINAMIGLRGNAQGAARVGTVETTVACAEYSHPKNQMLKFWDLPGVGTPTFPRETYLTKIDVNSYDCFVIMTSSRFTETDAWLAKEINRLGKHFYFARTKIHLDVKNDQHDNFEDHREEHLVLEEIRQNTREQLDAVDVSNRVYLIDNHKRTKYEFNELEITIVNNLSEEKRHAMILTLSAPTEFMIKMKTKELRKRVKFIAICSAAAATFPVEGLAIAFDMILLTSEMSFYCHQLCLDDESLKTRAEHMNVEFNSLKDIVKRIIPQGISSDMLRTLVDSASFKSFSPADIASIYSNLPAIVAAPISLFFTIFALNRMLEKMEKASLELVSKISAHG